jgi:outer membrane protein OmpA-like peptidoglycan-associated protein
MRNISLNIQKASSLVLLAFCLISTLSAQQIKSLSGANSPNDDTNPVWIGNNTLLFTRAFHPKNLGGITDPGDIWMTQKNNSGEWMTAVHLPELSSSGYDIALGLEDVLTLLILRQEKEGISVHQFSKFGQDWNYLRQINFPVVRPMDGEYVTGRIIEGGKQILLSAVLEGGTGNEDIYITEKNSPNDWSPLTSLGAVINGKGQEVGPFFDIKNQQLFFSTNSHLGATGKDIVIAKKIGDTWQSWSLPVKWEQISSRGSEASVTIIEGKEVVWTSTQNSDGFADLMTFSAPIPLELPSDFEVPQTEEKPQLLSPVQKVPNVVIPTAPLIDDSKVDQPSEISAKKETSISWKVIDKKTKIRLEYEISGLKGTEVIILSDSIFLSKLLTKGVTALKISSRGYFPLQIPLGILDDENPNWIQLTKAEPGSVILLENVNFQRGTSELETDGTQLVLEDLAKFLLENKELKIRINGHTDNLGDPGLNKQLSLERAGSVRDFMVSKGVDFERLRISGWGGTRPIASNVTESGRAQNRRVELVVEN